MFELPEFINLARQINTVLPGKVVSSGSLGNSPHKFVWYNRTPAEFAALVVGKTIGAARAKGRWLFIDLEPGYRLVFGECGGAILYHSAGARLPGKYHLLLEFSDGSALTAMTQMWGAMELYEHGKELERQYIKDMRPTPVEPEFSFPYFQGLLAEATADKKSAKGLLTQEQLIPGLGNAIAQDILFLARLHPRHPVEKLDENQQMSLYQAILSIVQAVIDRCGRYDEIDLFGKPGGYVRLMDKNSAGKPCPTCGTAVEKIQYLGGACYYCPACQPLS